VEHVRGGAKKKQMELLRDKRQKTILGRVLFEKSERVSRVCEESVARESSVTRVRENVRSVVTRVV
jgi:hypothetical protein